MKTKSQGAISETIAKKINGTFVLLVLISHFSQYANIQEFYILYGFLSVVRILGQLIVTPFLFFSGYGIYQRIKTDGDECISQFPKKRIFKTWLHFAMAITLFLPVGIIQRQEYSLSHILLSYVGWESLGNSNWYIVAILSMYLATYVSFSIKCDRRYSILLVFLLANVYVLLLVFLHKEMYWIDTIYSYPMGMFFAAYEEKFGGVIQKTQINLRRFVNCVDDRIIF